MKNTLRYSTSFIAPIVVCLILPYLILKAEHKPSIPPLNHSTGFLIAGLVLSAAGLVLAIATMRMFLLIGKGTIMPWDPSRKLVVVSLYAHVRNPMILSLIVLLAGEAFLFASYGIAVLAILFFVLNTVYFIFSEEPGLEKRFGAEYREYKRNVPRWLPRWKAWRPN